MRLPNPTDMVKAVAAWEWTATPAGMGYMRSRGAYGDSPVVLSTEAIFEVPEFIRWYETVFIPRMEKRGAIHRTPNGILFFGEPKGRIN